MHQPTLARPSRRAFLRIGALGLGGLTLPQLLQAEAAAGIRSSQKSVILIYLVGGPPHQDMFDLKPDAPKEIAGPWRPIATNVTGHPDLRGLSAAGPDHGQAGRGPLAGRQPGRPRRDPGLQRPPSQQADAARAAGRSSAPTVAKLQGAGRSERRRRSSACATPARTAPTTSRAPASSGTSLRPVPADGPVARRHGPPRHHRRSAGRPQDAAAELRHHAPRRRCQRHDEGHGHLHRAGVRAAHLVAAGRGARPVAGRSARSSSATAPATRRSSWTATAPRACRKAC